MRIFLTGATGFIGSALLPELMQAGHRVLGLARTEAGARSLRAAGAEVHRGNLADLASLQAGAARADGVIHTAFTHDFSRFQEVCEQDRGAIEALGRALAGSARPLLITSGTGMASGAAGRLRRSGSSRLERAHAGAAGLAPERPRSDRRSRAHALLGNLCTGHVN